MPFNTNGRNAMVGGLAANISHVSVHDAIPDAAGSDEISGGSYARQPVTWTAPAAGEADTDADLIHDIPAGSTAVAYGHWDALTAGNHYGHTLIGSTLSGFGAVDQSGVASDLILSAGHGLADGDRVALYNVLAEGLPGGLVERTLYWVVQAITNGFKVSLTQGGPAVDITSEGELWWQDCVPETFGADGELFTATGALALRTNVI